MSQIHLHQLPTNDPRAVAPLRVAGSGRYLEQADGQPFFWLADTAWELFHRLNLEDSRRYLRDRADKGFSVIQAVCLAELDGLSVPNASGYLPLEGKDPERVVEGYFAHVDEVIREASALGLFVGLLPTWGHYWTCAAPGTRSVFTETNARTYGLFLGRRYGQSPVIWILGGDHHVDNEEERAILVAMAEGLREGDQGRNFVSFHPRGPGRSSESWPEPSPLDFNMCQTSHAAREHDTGLSIAADYALVPPKPTLDGEPRYEGIPVGFYNTGTRASDRFDDVDVRSAAYGALLAGACGHTYGHNSIWQMWEPGRAPAIEANVPWLEALSHPGSFQMGYLARLWRSRPWHVLRPAPDFVRNAPTDGPARVRATFSAEPSLALVYSAEGQAFSCDLGLFTAAFVRVSWFDPRYGVLYPFHVHSSMAHQTFTPPTRGRGQDWLLVIEDSKTESPIELFAARRPAVTRATEE